MTKLTEQDKQKKTKEALRYFKNGLKQGDRVYTVLTKESPSGMMRHIKVLITSNGSIINISFYVANLLDYKYNRDTASVVVPGCGMDMGFHLIYQLAGTLFPRQDNNNQGTGYWLNQSWL